MTIRVRLARWLVGYPYMMDPLIGEDGAFVVIRKGGTVATIRAASFRLRSEFRTRDGLVATSTFGSDEELERAGIGRRWGRFVGTVDYRR